MPKLLSLLILIPTAAYACTPVVPLINLYLSHHLIQGSLVGLFIAVTLKSFLFAKFEDSIEKKSAFKCMFLGNLASTVIGILAAIGMIGGFMPLITTAIFVVLTSYPLNALSKRIDSKYLKGKNIVIGSILIGGLYLSSVIIWVYAIKSWDGLNAHPLYWLMKIFYSFIALIFSLSISALYEEMIIYKRSNNQKNHYFPSVARANIYTMLVLMLYPAIEALPERFKNPDFLLFYH
jgi:hypothetical protein